MSSSVRLNSTYGLSIATGHRRWSHFHIVYGDVGGHYAELSMQKVGTSRDNTHCNVRQHSSDNRYASKPGTMERSYAGEQL